MKLLPPTPNTERRMKQQLFKKREDIDQDVQHLRDWLSKQPHLPQVDDVLLERFLYSCKYSLSRCKTVLDMYYTVRGAVPEFFKERDPTADDIRRSCEVSIVIPLPRLSPAGYRIFVHHLLDTDVNKFNPRSHFKRAFMTMDALLREENILGCIIIVDMKNCAWSHVTKLPLLLLKKLSVCGQEAYPLRIKEINFVNAPGFIYKFLGIIKPLLKKKLAERIHVYSNGLEPLYKSVPKCVLPEDYGGDEKSIKELSDSFQQTLESYKDWFVSDELKVADESKRPGERLEYGELFGVEGSFKKLTID